MLFQDNLPIKLYYISDLHLEFLLDEKGFHTEKLQMIEQLFLNTQRQLDNQSHAVLLLGGDIIWAKHFHKIQPFLDSITSGFEHTFIILGNHDYWRSTPLRSYQKVKEAVAHLNTVSVLENETVNLNQRYDLFGATYWYAVKPHEEYALNVMNDFRYIKTNDFKRFTYRHVEQLYRQSQHALHQALVNAFEQHKSLVLFTHHAPSEGFMLYNQHANALGYGTIMPTDLLTCCDLYDLVDVIKASIHGHSHNEQRPLCYENEFNIPTYMNTLGYLGYEYHMISEKGWQEMVEHLAKDVEISSLKAKFVRYETDTLPFILLE